MSIHVEVRRMGRLKSNDMDGAASEACSRAPSATSAVHRLDKRDKQVSVKMR
jgi:hypothetical protein